MSQESVPDHDDEALRTAYLCGDFARVRQRANELLRDPATSEPARSRARVWLTRVSVDVVVYAVLGFALLLFCAIVVRYAHA